MAEHTHKTYSCDRCKADLGSERPKRTQLTLISAGFNWTDGPGPSFQWSDLCDPCNLAVRAFFLRDALSLSPSKEDRHEARIWFAGVLSGVNTEMAEYVMVRAKRMIGPRNEN